MIHNWPTYRIMKSLIKETPEIMPKETILIRHFGTSTYKNNYMFYLTDKITQYLVEAGIPQQLRQYVIDYHFPIKEQSSDPLVFKVEDLDFGFVVWLGACAISTCVFLVEFLSVKIKLLVQNVCGLRALIIILKTQRFY